MSQQSVVGPSPWEEIAPAMFDESRWADAPAEVELALDLLRVRRRAAILDLACGPGRHLLELARRGYRATGVDATGAFVQAALERAARDELSVELVHEDMRRFRRDGAFDAVLSMSTSFGYFEDPADDRLVLDNVRCSLRAGGVLLMELMGKEVVSRTLKTRERAEEDGVVLLTEQRARDDWTWVDNRLVVLAGGRRQELVLSHRLYSEAELERLLTEAGFASVTAYGNLAGAPYDEAATRLVALART